MKRRHQGIDSVLKKGMFLFLLGLSVALAWKGVSGYLEQTKQEMSMENVWASGRSWLAAGLASWIRGSYSMSVWNWKDRNEETGIDMDPSYERYMEQQKIMKETAYLLLFGDENSQAEQVDAAGETADFDGQVEQLTQLTPAYHGKQELPVTGTQYVMEQLMDYDFLMSHFYSVHSSTTAGRDEMDAKRLLQMDLSIEKNAAEPQILVYHTHSQEEFADYGPDNRQATIVGVGTYLTELLEAKGYQVIHDTTEYDMMDGVLDRNHAYNYALEGVTAILQQNPSIQVVLDIHRDGVAENLHMVTEVNGKQTAQIMFFNGMSQTPDGPIEYLQNPYKEENLAFSLQMQLDAAAYFPGFTRKIYLKGLRYNLHLRPRSSLIEVGAQTNTYEEAKNAMEPLAELLDMVLSPVK